MVDSHLFAYQISTKETFQIGTQTGAQSGSVIANGVVAWMDYRNVNNPDIYAAYIASPGDEFVVCDDSSQQSRPRIFGDTIAWNDERNSSSTNYYDIYAYSLSRGEEFAVTTTSNAESIAAMDADNIFWLGNDYNSYGAINSYTIATAVTQRLMNSPIHTLRAQIADYSVVVFGDGFGGSGNILPLFDAADAAGVNILGLGTGYDKDALGNVLVGDERFGLLSEGYTYEYAPMEIDLTTAGSAHAIANGLPLAGTIVLEDSGGTMDEVAYATDPNVSDSPADWTPLANLGPRMYYAGETAIVEFTTPTGTRVMLDGSANSADHYQFWNQTRWDLLYAEVNYLAQ
jgi:beta propeller repeat protein